jgi:Ser/Thr protein kinase RdoA (MazF antagonist)
VPAAPPERLREIERRALDWRWRLKPGSRRLSRTHGDFHPFNVVFDGDQLALLDASRGCMGDPADDVTCMAINYVFFAVEHPGAWRGALGELWRRFWQLYLDESGDHELLRVCAPFLAWRGLVVANPVWYPAVDPAARDRVLALIERALAAEQFDPSFAEALFP